MRPELSDPPRFLLMKTSSLGDVLHNLAVVSDLQRVFPGSLCRDTTLAQRRSPGDSRSHPAMAQKPPVT
jgi:ADP-heptose:LPS heptosyltransferase